MFNSNLISPKHLKPALPSGKVWDG